MKKYTEKQQKERISIIYNISIYICISYNLYLSINNKNIEYFINYIYTSISMRNYIFLQEVVEKERNIYVLLPLILEKY